MFSQSLSRRKNGAIALVALWFVGLLVPATLVAEPIGETSSLKFVPADTAFYGSVLRNRQKYDAIANSNVVKRLLEVPAIKMGVDQLKAQWNEPTDPQMAMAKAMLDMPENKELVAMLIDMISNEIFCYGGAEYGDLLDLFAQINRANQQLTFAGLEDGDGPSENELAKQIIALLAKNSDRLKIPDTVIGFKLTDAKRAQTQLQRLETLATIFLAQQPELKMRYQKQQISGGEFLVFSLDGTMIPWDQIPQDEIPEETQEDFDKLVDLVKEKTLVISLGIRDDYLLLSIADSNDHLKALDQGKLLLDRTELAALRKDAEKPITSISYTSQQFIENLSSPKKSIDDLVTLAEAMLPFSDLDEDLKDELIVDVKALGSDLKKFIPELGARMGYCFFTERGYEGYQYNWGENLTLDGSKELSILDHLGGDPLFYVASRQKSSAEGYGFLVKWAKRGFRYFDHFVQQQIENEEGEEELEKYKKFRNSVMPLVAEFDQTTSKMLIPALEDGQSAFVLDAKTVSDRWFAMMPPGSQPLPMLELGLVYGVSDPGLLKQAFSSYFKIAQEVANKLHEADPDEIPEVTFVEPREREFPSGTVYYYTFLKKLGFDQRIALNAGLSDKFAAVSILPLHTKRLLDETPLLADRLTDDRDRPLAAAAGLNFAGLIDAITPWIDYGFDASQEFDISTQVQQDPTEEIKGYIHLGLDILKCFRGFSSASYLQDDANVTHYELHFEDLKQ